MRSAGAGAPDTAGRVNSLGLSARQLESLLNRIDTPGRVGHRSKKRLYLRWAYRHESLRLAVVHPGGNSVEFRVAGRNLSVGGASVLHSAFVYPGSSCRIWLPHPALGEVEVAGRVARCTHIHRMIHELGLAFDSPIRVRAFIPGADETTPTLEHVEPDQLTGSVLCVEESDLERRIVSHFLRPTRLDVVFAPNAADAPAAVARGCDLLLCHCHPDNRSCSDLIHSSRRINPDLPIVVAVSDAGAPARAAVQALRVNAFLVKPYAQSALLRAIGEILLVRRCQVGHDTSRFGAAAAPGLPGGVMHDLRGAIEDIARSRADSDTMSCHSACTRLRDAAPAVGLEQIGRLANEAANCLATTASLEGARRVLDDLLTLCRVQLPAALEVARS